MELIEDLGYLLPLPTSKQAKRYGIYKCSFCGVEFKVQTAKVSAGQKQCNSCARKRGRKHKTHGMNGTRLFATYSNMKSRCNNKAHKAYKYYGGKGVKVCEEWQDPQAFFDWALSSGYSETLTIDREDSDGDYSPDNCRWVSVEAQSQNRGKLQNCSSKYVGVRKHQSGSYEARVMISGKRTQVGLFKDEYEAALERDKFIIASGNIYSKLNILTR